MLSGCSNQADKAAQPKSSTVDAAAKTANADNAASQEHQGELPVIDAIVTHAPEVPPPVDRDHPAKVVVKMETVEKSCVWQMAWNISFGHLAVKFQGR